jgi:hypothetical protein
MLDEELREYQSFLGKDEFWAEYHRIYSHTQNIRKYNSRYEETDTEPDLDKIRKKYKDGVTDNILREWLGDSNGL